MSRTLFTSLALAVTLAASMAAHHSPVMFDRTVSKTIVGTVV